MKHYLEYFPEHSERINNPVQANALMSRGIQNEDIMVINETKNISDSEQIVYQEYASGRANIIFIVDDNVVQTQTGSGYTYKCVDIQVYSWLCAGSMYIDGFAYTIYDNAYDAINDFGYLGLSQLTQCRGKLTKMLMDQQKLFILQCLGILMVRFSKGKLCLVR